MAKLELFSPVSPLSVTQPFGVNGDYYRKNGINIIGHNGVDLFAAHGQPVRAAHDGVAYVSKDDREGWGVVVRTNEPREWNGNFVFFKTIYWHLLPNIPVKNDQQVRVGDVIGFADNSGFSGGDHLHFGLKPQLLEEESGAWYNVRQQNGYLGAIDPAPFMNRVPAEVAGTMLELIARVKAFLASLKGRSLSFQT